MLAKLEAEHKATGRTYPSRGVVQNTTDAQRTLLNESDTDEVIFPEQRSATRSPGVMIDNDGNMFRTANVDDDDEPSQSSWIQTGDDLDKISDDTVKRIHEMAVVEQEEDMRLVNNFKHYLNPPNNYIGQRAFDLARLGGIGLARTSLRILTWMPRYIASSLSISPRSG
jgi:hypothetical protein